ncbi:MAG TPA: ABC transporter permease [Polyangiaceae bacterium]|nr:ABC transporter permease [Polyangiaceae bacterium]
MQARLVALMVKELLVVLRDPRSRIILIGPPLVQLLVFVFAATLEVKNVDVVVLNRDEGAAGLELVRRIEGSPTFRTVKPVHDPADLRSAIDRERAIAAIEIGPDFSRDLIAGRPASVQISLDGRRSNAAQIVDGYLGEIVAGFVVDENERAHHLPTIPRVVARNWFNPNLTFRWFTVPGLIAIIAQLIGLIVTALSVARERELGTFDQLIVAPLRTHEILLGKMLPPLIIGLAHMTLYVIAAVVVFRVPIRGSLLLLYASGVIFLAAVVGVGLFISSLCATQQQAILGAFLFLAPATLLSGFATPIDNMPPWLRPVTLVNPLRYFLVITRGVFLKGMSAADVAGQTLPLALIAVCTLTAAAWLFRGRME